VRPALLLAPGQNLVQARGVDGQHANAFVQVPVPGGDPSPGASGQPAPVRDQPSEQLPRRFLRDVEGGTLGDHVGLRLRGPGSWSKPILDRQGLRILRAPRPRVRHLPATR
jgi:hypothetical protein